MPSPEESSQCHFDNILALCEESAEKILNDEKAPSSRKRKANRIGPLFLELSQQLGRYQELVLALTKLAPFYDSHTGVKANGYRSFVRIAVNFVSILKEYFMQIRQKGPKFLNETDHKPLQNWLECLKRLIDLKTFLLELHKHSELDFQRNGSRRKLFPSDLGFRDRGSREVDQMVSEMALEDYSCFFNVTAGFHLKGDCRSLAFPVLASLASYADIYDGSYISRIRKVTGSLFCFKYAYDTDLLAKRAWEAVRNKPVEFTKTFYNFSELDLFCKASTKLSRKQTSIKANVVIKVPFERMMVMNTQGAAFQVPLPSGPLSSPQTLQMRLISPFRTPDMVGSCPCTPSSITSCTCSITPESSCILLHFHGGGFVSQTSKSHASYLAHWAKDLGIPILSVDYSLAPEAPYPRAAEEVLYAYCWMRNNFPSLGTTGQKVIIAGDSAGANLGLGLTMRCIQFSLPKPDHVVAIYPSLLCQILISMLDPIVMFPCLLRCVNSYADKTYVQTCPRTFEDELSLTSECPDPLLSPLLMSRDVLSSFPPVLLVSTDVDPCLDETIAFSNKLHDARAKVELEVLTGLPHGFLSFHGFSKECQNAGHHLLEKIRDLVLT